MSFDQACRELHHRVEAMRADEFLDSRQGKALISTEGKRNGQQAVPVPKVACLAKDCVELIQPYLPLCKLCYLQCMAGKTPTLALRDNLGNAIFNAQTKKLEFPAAVPKSRFPKKGDEERQEGADGKPGELFVGFRVSRYPELTVSGLRWNRTRFDIR